jgi:secretion/DNA translocation related TadE-like protein
MKERGAAALTLLGIVGLLLILGVALGAVGTYLRARVEAGAAADAAALAAAPVTFLPFGALGTAADEAAEFARLNGFELVSCECAQDPSWEERTVTVTVARWVRLWPVGSIRIEAASRAEFVPALLLDLDTRPP